MGRRAVDCVCVLVCWAWTAPGNAAPPAPGPAPQFETDVRPILAARCFECHGADTQESKLDLRSVSAMLRGGRGGPVLVRGAPERSELLEMLSSGQMPPGKSQRLPAEQIALIRRWVEAGAPAAEKVIEPSLDAFFSPEEQRHWAFQPLARPKVPTVSRLDRARTPVDAFLLAKLEAKGLTFSVEADAAALVRRLSFDLTGLPPSPEDLASFQGDSSEAAYERLVDRLLASPHFGQRFGRYWLDAAGYTDVYGSDNDATIIKLLPGRWRYRDYVVDAFNADKPLDRFLLEQLAGDELYDWRSAEALTPEMLEALIATGFLLSAADDTDAPELNTPDVRHRVLQLTGEIVASNLLGVTMACAKCHNHKYEPIAQRDYYAFLANFAPVFNLQQWVVSTGHALPDVAPAEKARIDRHNGQIDEQTAQLKQRQIAYEKGDAAARDHLQRQVALLETQRRSHGTIQAVHETGANTQTFVLRRGDYLKPGVAVESGLPLVLRPTARASQLGNGPFKAGSTSGRRLVLARQLTDSGSRAGALVARVLVNRVWQQLFGEGLAATSDNLGRSGASPAHPELLEWLANEFVRSGWRVKPLVRLLVTSTAYRQASTGAAQAALAEKLDPDNRLLWRMRLRRLDSESVRDAMLAASGALQRTFGGESLPLDVRPDGKVVVKAAGPERFRRSLYVLARRNYHLSLLDTFDQPAVSTNCTRRQPSAVVTQPLTLLNDEFVLQQAEMFARRVIDEAAAGQTPDARPRQIERAFQLALGRSPQPVETRWCAELLDAQAVRARKVSSSTGESELRAMTHLCHVLLNTNEFLYIP
jgi:mono/diheme cytochrome c family protein